MIRHSLKSAKESITVGIACLMMLTASAGCKDKDNSDKKRIDPEKMVEEWAEASLSPTGGETYYTYSMLDDQIQELKDKDKWDDMVDSFNDNIKKEFDDATSVEIKKIEKGNDLDVRKLVGAEYYLFKTVNIDDRQVTKGCFYKIKYRAKKADGDRETNTQKIAIVKLKDGDWKVIPCDTVDLDDCYNESGVMVFT